MRQQIQPASAMVVGPANSADGRGAVVVALGVAAVGSTAGICSGIRRVGLISSNEGTLPAVAWPVGHLRRRMRAGSVVGTAATDKARADPNSAIAPAKVTRQLNMPCQTPSR